VQVETDRPETELWTATPRGSPLAEAREQRPDRRSPDLEVIKLELDKDGAPVTIEPRAWFVCFVPGLKRQWWQRLLTATITLEQARKFLIWGARGDALHAREAVPGHGSQVRGWMTCATLASYRLGRRYWVWTPHGLYKLLLCGPGVCCVDGWALLRLDEAQLPDASSVIAACEAGCAPRKHQPGAPKPFCMDCGRDLVPGWSRRKVRSENDLGRPRPAVSIVRPLRQSDRETSDAA
jgi:hypothetical protein